MTVKTTESILNSPTPPSMGVPCPSQRTPREISACQQEIGYHICTVPQQCTLTMCSHQPISMTRAIMFHALKLSFPSPEISTTAWCTRLRVRAWLLSSSAKIGHTLAPRCALRTAKRRHREHHHGHHLPMCV